MGRRNFLLGVLAAGGRRGRLAEAARLSGRAGDRLGSGQAEWVVPGPYSTNEMVTAESAVTTYNNYYEFGTGKADPSKNAKNFQTSPWSVSVEGEVAKPRKFTMDEILKLAPLEERIYRHRCVEAWSIVVPWIGYSLSTILKQVQPNSNAKYVAFQSYYDREADAARSGCGHRTALRRRPAPG